MPPPEMQQIPPQPVPTVYGFDHTEDGSHVVMVSQTPLGTIVQFITVENVEAMATALMQQKQLAEGARSPKLDIPGKVLLGPGGNPLRLVPPATGDVE